MYDDGCFFFCCDLLGQQNIFGVFPKADPFCPFNYQETLFLQEATRLDCVKEASAATSRQQQQHNTHSRARI
jgi:hypothetical protein